MFYDTGAIWKNLRLGPRFNPNTLGVSWGLWPEGWSWELVWCNPCIFLS